MAETEIDAPGPKSAADGNSKTDTNSQSTGNNNGHVPTPESASLSLLPLCQVDRYWLQKLVWRHSANLSAADATSVYPSLEDLSQIPIYASAPMVDQSDLPFRLQCRRYGTNLCFTPMIHAKLFVTQKTYHTKFQLPKSNPNDRPLIAQLCGSNPEMLWQCALQLQDHCDGIDLNCGCPQGIARRGNYGAFLLEQQETLLNVVRYLAPRLKVPLSVKVRLLPAEEDEEGARQGDASLSNSLQLYQSLADAGIHLLTIHGRTRHQKKQLTGRADWSAIRQAAHMLRDKIPVLANGSIASAQDVQECLEATRADGVMSSEAILEYPPLFAPLVEDRNENMNSSNNNPPPRVGRLQLAREYMELARQYPPEQGGQGSGFKCIRVHVHRFLHADLQTHTYLRDAVVRAQNVDELESSLDLVQELHNKNNVQEQLSWYYRHWMNEEEGNDENLVPHQQASHSETSASKKNEDGVREEEEEEEDADRMGAWLF